MHLHAPLEWSDGKNEWRHFLLRATAVWSKGWEGLPQMDLSFASIFLSTTWSIDSSLQPLFRSLWTSQGRRSPVLVWSFNRSWPTGLSPKSSLDPTCDVEVLPSLLHFLDSQLLLCDDWTLQNWITWTSCPVLPENGLFFPRQHPGNMHTDTLFLFFFS